MTFRKNYALNIRNFKLDSWLPMLKILRIEECQIQTIEPLWGCPFLEEICLKNNLIADLNCLAALSPCQDLKVIDLEGNPISENYRLLFVLDLFFKKAEVFLSFFTSSAKLNQTDSYLVF
jgi:Leucine-rich repeat (LRR) protein